VIRYSRILRVLITLLAMLSWTVTTSHCPLIAATAPIGQTGAEENDQSECPMHAVQHSAPEPSKDKNGCPDLPCCKKLPAAKPATQQWIYKPIVWLEPATYFPIVLELLAQPSGQVIRLRLDTGPPGPDQFLELVLQRSIPAHGPPKA